MPSSRASSPLSSATPSPRTKSYDLPDKDAGPSRLATPTSDRNMRSPTSSTAPLTESAESELTEEEQEDQEVAVGNGLGKSTSNNGRVGEDDEDEEDGDEVDKVDDGRARSDAGGDKREIYVPERIIKHRKARETRKAREARMTANRRRAAWAEQSITPARSHASSPSPSLTPPPTSDLIQPSALPPPHLSPRNTLKTNDARAEDDDDEDEEGESQDGVERDEGDQQAEDEVEDGPSARGVDHDMDQAQEEGEGDGVVVGDEMRTMAEQGVVDGDADGITVKGDEEEAGQSNEGEDSDVGGSEGEDDAEVEGQGDGQEQQDGEDAEADATAAPFLARPVPSSHASPPTSAAMRQLFILELKFAALRDKLYVERMEEAAAEEDMVVKGTHPALKFMFKTLAERREKLHEVASRRHQQALSELKRAREADKSHVWSWWTDERDRMHWEEFEETWSKRRRLAREKNEIETPRVVKPVPRMGTRNVVRGFDWSAGAAPQKMSLEEAAADLAVMETRRAIHPSRHASPANFAAASQHVNHGPPVPANQTPPTYPYNHTHSQAFESPHASHTSTLGPSRPPPAAAAETQANIPRKEGRTVPTTSDMFETAARKVGRPENEPNGGGVGSGAISARVKQHSQYQNPSPQGFLPKPELEKLGSRYTDLAEYIQSTRPRTGSPPVSNTTSGGGGGGGAGSAGDGGGGGGGGGGNYGGFLSGTKVGLLSPPKTATVSVLGSLGARSPFNSPNPSAMPVGTGTSRP